MRLRFTKMQGAGNDFVMLDGVRQRIDLTPAQLRHLADRRLGVGADQILLVEAADRANVDFRYCIFNADGGEVVCDEQGRHLPLARQRDHQVHHCGLRGDIQPGGRLVGD